ncbi:peptide/nickel transport system substrate-binding protein [Sphingomonas naasensis]|uniref:ABC transporter substrate-binding protein n=1 Tax=Sphingomonas naasensis TaxID=1344951 RepID=A0A4S1WB09_9SPHN|nr:ABC transporter substrate-binding protein [Sphingomonas naasensis]NIJ19401.1 peptide/nickel transport system substrate-binding protein [Sphingomonas naasensis]TGX39145.1 ABC transporter substrate-binding protein [Sphingomonas naasensis]
MNRSILPVLLALGLATGGCGNGQRKDDAPVVVSAIGGEARAADPSAGPLDPAERVLMGATAQGLVRFDATGQIEPGLAERWIVIDDGRSYIFRLREAYWPDGTPVTAAQVVRVLRRAAAPASRNALAPFLAVIDEIVEMTPTVIEVRLKRPRPDLLKLFAQPELAVFRTGTLDGSGPFLARAMAGGPLLIPARDPQRQDNATPEPEETVRLHGERAALAIARFKAGESDLVLGGTFADWPIVDPAKLAPANVRLDQPNGLFGLAVMLREGFLADPANRAAIAMAIDRAALTREVQPHWAPVETILPGKLDSAALPAQPGWATLPIAARRDAARAQVAAWRRQHPEPLVVRIALPAGPGATLVWAHLAEALVAIGIEPRRVGPGATAELKLIDAVAPYDSGRWFVQTACVACPDTLEALILAGREAPDLAARAQRIAEADAALTGDSSYIPIAQPLRWSLVALRLDGWQRNARAWHPLNHLRNETE